MAAKIKATPQTGGEPIAGQPVNIEVVGGVPTAILVTGLNAPPAASWSADQPNAAPALDNATDPDLDTETIFVLNTTAGMAGKRLKVDVTVGGVVYTKTIFYADPAAIIRTPREIPDRLSASAILAADFDQIEQDNLNKSQAFDITIAWYEEGVPQFKVLGQAQPFALDFLAELEDGSPAKVPKSIVKDIQIKFFTFSQALADWLIGIGDYSRSAKIQKENLPNPNQCSHGVWVYMDGCDFSLNLFDVIINNGITLNSSSADNGKDNVNVLILSINTTNRKIISGIVKRQAV